VEAFYLDNRSKSVKTAALEALETADRADIAVAYSSPEGVRALEDGLTNLAERGGEARLLAGLDDFITDLRAAERFAELPRAEVKVFLPTSVGDRARFHPKLYVFEGRDESSVIVGSANLTGAGLETNYEADATSGEGTDPRHHDNVSLRRAMELGKPLIWFIGQAAGVFTPLAPVWLAGEEPAQRQFVVPLTSGCWTHGDQTLPSRVGSILPAATRKWWFSSGYTSARSETGCSWHTGNNAPCAAFVTRRSSMAPT
jgi:PLD-like domain